MYRDISLRIWETSVKHKIFNDINGWMVRSDNVRPITITKITTLTPEIELGQLGILSVYISIHYEKNDRNITSNLSQMDNGFALFII